MNTHPTNDIYKIVPTGGIVQTRRGKRDEFALLRNGVTVVTSTQKDCESERDRRERSGKNPLRSIGGQIA
jgi:hypothetical protein